MKSVLDSSRLEDKLHGFEIPDYTDASPARFISDSPVTKDTPKVLYGNVLSECFSQGGEGFVLHKGDVVMIMQFLPNYNLVEVKWYGM